MTIAPPKPHPRLANEHLFARIWGHPPAEQSPLEEHAPLRDRAVVAFEGLFDRARTGTIRVEIAECPQGCAVDSGEVTFALGRTGAMIVHVRRGACSSTEFRLRLLFETGACVFASPRDLGHFCTGLLASAFGIETNEPIAETGPSSARPTNERAIESDHGANDLLADLGASTAAAGTPAANPSTGVARETAELDDSAPPLDNAVHLPLLPRRALTAETLATELAGTIRGQGPALERVASATVAQLTKRHPARPGSVMLIGPSGVGDTSTIEALPAPCTHSAGPTRTGSGSTAASSPTPSRSRASSVHLPAIPATPKPHH